MHLTESPNHTLVNSQLCIPGKKSLSFCSSVSEYESGKQSCTLTEESLRCHRRGKHRRSHSAATQRLAPDAIMSFKNTNALCGDLEKLLNLPEMCDVKFLVGQSRTPVYGVKAILATRNRAFFSMILSQQKCIVHSHLHPAPKKASFLTMIKDRFVKRPQTRHLVLEVPEIDPTSFRKVITYLQTGDIKVDINDVIGVMNAADRYALDDLRDACYRFARKSISLKTVFTLIKSTELYWTSKWTQAIFTDIIKFITRRANKVLGTKDFMSLSLRAAGLILCHNDMTVFDEKKWDTALRWTKQHYRHQNKKLFKSALKELTRGINFCNIPLNKLLSEVKPALFLHDDVISKAIAHWSTQTSVVYENIKPTNGEARPVGTGKHGQINRMFSCCSSESLRITHEPMSPKSLDSEYGFVINSESSLLL